MNNRRLSLNITSTAPRRQSLTVEGLSSAFKDLAASSGNATGSLRNKAALKPGHSLMGWINLTSTAKDLNGQGGKIIEVTADELSKHDSPDDCWICIKGNVYNVTAYLQYHPGGVDELMRGVGTDATDLFSEVHSWVNYESILAKCFVGPLKTEIVPVTIPSSASASPIRPPLPPPPQQSTTTTTTATTSPDESKDDDSDITNQVVETKVVEVPATAAINITTKDDVTAKAANSTTSSGSGGGGAKP